VGVFQFPYLLAGWLDYEQARNMLLSCPLVLIITLAVNVQSGPAAGVAHEFLHHLYPFALLNQEANSAPKASEPWLSAAGSEMQR
jgi:hypothetical protein